MEGQAVTTVATVAAEATREDKTAPVATRQMAQTATAEAPRRARPAPEAMEVGGGMVAMEGLSLAVMGIARRERPRAVAVRAGLVVARRPGTTVPVAVVQAMWTRPDAPS